MKPLNQPALRFAGFADAWEQRKLGEIVTKQIKGKAQLENLQHGSVEYLDASRLNGGNVLLSNGIQNVLQDDILILWDGSKAGTVYTGFTGVLGSTLKAYQVGSNSQFVYQFLKYNQDNIYANYRTPNIPHVQKDFLDVFEISLPLDQEQAVIGNFFRQLDEAIAAHQRKLEKIKELKNSLLHKMFPKDGETVPELRLSGFTDAWEQRKLGECGYTKSGVGFPEQEQGGKEGIPFLKVSDMNLDGNEITITIANHYVSESQIKKRGWRPINDVPAIIFAKVGAALLLDRKRLVLNNFLIDNNMMAYCLGLDWDIYFCKNLFEFIKLSDLSQVGALPSLRGEDIENLDITLPANKHEQTAIGNFFRQLDTVIEAYQQKSNQLHTLKTALLGKMFV